MRTIETKVFNWVAIQCPKHPQEHNSMPCDDCIVPGQYPRGNTLERVVKLVKKDYPQATIIAKGQGTRFDTYSLNEA